MRVVRLGSPRVKGEGLRLGTVRRPPRGVPKSRWADDNWFDVWLPLLAPLPETIKLVHADANPRQWAAFARRYRREMAQPDPRHVLELLAALSQSSNFSVGCYCADESRCHRSLLVKMLFEAGAIISASD